MGTHESEEELRQRLKALTVEHRDLDDAISGLQRNTYVNQLQIQRLKRRKLLLKDQIAFVRSKLIPDLNA